MKTPQDIDAWLKELKRDKAYDGLDVEREYGKMVRWCEVHRKQPTKRRFIAWLNRVEPIWMQSPKKVYGHNYLPNQNELSEDERNHFVRIAKMEIAALKEKFRV